MVLGLIFEDGDPFAFDGVGDDDAGLSGHAAAGLKGLQELGDIVAVHLQGVPAEGLPFRGQGLEAHDFSGAAVDLQAVAVHDGREVVQAVVGRAHGRFPDLPLLALAVPHAARRCGC